METNPHHGEELVYDLIESKDWEALTEAEQSLALQHLTREEYILQREIFSAMSENFEEDLEEPLPLMIPQQRKPFVLRSVPMYQAIAAVAAVIVLFLLIRPGAAGANPMQPEGSATPMQAASETKYIHDTVIHYVNTTRKETKTILDTVREFIAFPNYAGEPRLLEASAGTPAPEINGEKLRTRGPSLKEENTAHLVPKVVNTIY